MNIEELPLGERLLTYMPSHGDQRDMLAFVHRRVGVPHHTWVEYLTGNALVPFELARHMHRLFPQTSAEEWEDLSVRTREMAVAEAKKMDNHSKVYTTALSRNVRAEKARNVKVSDQANANKIEDYYGILSLHKVAWIDALNGKVRLSQYAASQLERHLGLRAEHWLFYSEQAFQARKRLAAAYAAKNASSDHNREYTELEQCTNPLEAQLLRSIPSIGALVPLETTPEGMFRYLGLTASYWNGVLYGESVMTDSRAERLAYEVGGSALDWKKRSQRSHELWREHGNTRVWTQDLSDFETVSPMDFEPEPEPSIVSAFHGEVVRRSYAVKHKFTTVSVLGIPAKMEREFFEKKKAVTFDILEALARNLGDTPQLWALNAEASGHKVPPSFVAGPTAKTVKIGIDKVSKPTTKKVYISKGCLTSYAVRFDPPLDDKYENMLMSIWDGNNAGILLEPIVDGEVQKEGSRWLGGATDEYELFEVLGVKPQSDSEEWELDASSWAQKRM